MYFYIINNNLMKEKEKHWEIIYETKKLNEVSWFQKKPLTSLSLIESSDINKSSEIIDIGCGKSFLIDNLLEKKYSKISLLDISNIALKEVEKRTNNYENSGRFYNVDILDFKSNTSFDLWHDRAVFHFLTKKEEIIIEIIEELKVITSADEDLILGISASRNGEFDQAIDYFYSSILKNPNNATTHYFLGKSLIRIGLDSEAEKKYRKALELNPSYSEVYNSLGLLYSSQGSFDEAIDSYTEAISLNQNYSSPYINRGLIFYNLGSYQKALFDFTRALEIEPKSSVALINRANVYSAMGAKEAVCEDLNKLCSLGNCTSLDNLKDSGYCKY